MGSNDVQICFWSGEGLLALPSGERIPPPGQGVRPSKSLVLVPFRTLSVQPFTLPFSHAAQIRDALRLRFRPLLGADGGAILPSIVTREPRSCGGVAWVISGAELKGLEEILGPDGAVRVLPLPMALTPADGEGISLVADEDQVTGLAWSGGQPTVYRWWPRRRRSPEQALQELALGSGLDAEKAQVVDLQEDLKGGLQRLQTGARQFLSTPGPFRDLDLSGRGIDTAVRADLVMGSFRRFTAAVVLSGALAAAVAGGLYVERSRYADRVDARAEALYRETFPGSGVVRDPLSQARARLRQRETGAETEDVALVEVLGAVGTAWDDKELRGVSLETLRYNPDGADLTGTAVDVAEIDRLQQRFDGSGFVSNLGDIQQIGGGRLRFTLSLEMRQP